MTSEVETLLRELPTRIQSAINHFWYTRNNQIEKQKISGKSDAGLRGAVTGGSQMDGFINLIKETILSANIPSECIFTKSAIELPGFFSPTKEWDLLVVRDKTLLVALEAKSQVGPSFGNNFNNRTEEAMGSALDLWTAFREEKFNGSIQPWLGYIFLLENSPKSQSPVRVKEPHFKVFPEFKNASYCKRYELFCRKLKLERQYNSTAFLTTKANERSFEEPADDLRVEFFYVH